MQRRNEIGDGNELDPLTMDKKRIWYGKYAGELWTHLPKNYLKWMVNECTHDMDKAQRGEKTPYFQTGYINFDSYAGGFVENGLTVVAGRPSMGKSSFTSGPIMSALTRQESIVVYSMEVEDKKALLRLISFKSEEPLSRLKVGLINNFEKYASTKKTLIGADTLLSIVDRTGMSLKDLEWDIIRRVKADKNIKSIIIDHLLQMSIDTNKHSPTELGNITKMLKRLGQKYKLSIVLLSQLNRSLESRDNKRPQMSDLQGSGSIEQDADMIVFLYRSEYYREKDWDSEKDGQYQKMEVENAEIIIGKNRDGPTGSVEIGFRSDTVSFLNDSGLIESIDYVDDDIIDEGEEATIKESEDIIHHDSNVEMPLI